MAKTANSNRPESWSEILTPESLSLYGHLPLTFPAGEFDPDGVWTQRWQIYVLRKNKWEAFHQGHIEISRKPEKKRVQFSVRQANFQGPQQSPVAVDSDVPSVAPNLLRSVCDTKAELTCLADRFLTPESWTLRTALRYTDGRDFEGTRMAKKMRMRAGGLELTCNGKSSFRHLPAGNVTSNWGLLNVLSTIDTPRPPAFTLLDELDKVKINHKLHRMEDRQIIFGSRKVTVHCYHQIGRGCLPWEYYVDVSTRRVLLALSGLRAYIMNDGAAEKTAQFFPGFDTNERPR